MTNSSPETDVKRLIEWLAAVVGAINCTVAPLLFASGQQPLFPLPGFYFIEIMLLGISVLVATAAPAVLWSRPIPWLAAGVLLAFVLLGGFSIGFYLIPALIAFLLVGLLADWQLGGIVGKHVVLFFIAAILQAGLMLLLLSIA